MKTSPLLLFTLVKYLSYALLFARGFLLAKYLDPYFFGVWGFVTLYQQYIGVTGLGLQYSVNAELAIRDLKNPSKEVNLINTSITITLLVIVALVVGGAFLQLLQVPIFKTENAFSYAFLIFTIGALQHYQQLFANIYRVYNDLKRIALAEIIIVLSTVVVIFFFDKAQLLNAILVSWVIGLLLACLIYVIKAPFRIQLRIFSKESKVLLKTGIPLLVYNFSFYLILMSSRTIISIFYDVETMGLYSFANSITNATLLGINTIAWVFFPMLVDKLKSGVAQEQVYDVIRQMLRLYITIVFLTIFFAVIFSPLIFLYLPKYQAVQSALHILFLTQAIWSIGFVFVTLAIARRKHNQIAILSLISVLCAASLGLIFASFKLDFFWLAISVLASYLLLTVLVTRYGIKMADLKLLKYQEVFPLYLVIPFVCFLVGTFAPLGIVWQLAGLGIFLVLNKSNLIYLTKKIKEAVGSKIL